MANAYRAGMKHHEFFGDITPHETETQTIHTMEGQFGLAWRIEVVRRMGKKLPRRPSDLWKEKKVLMSPDEMFKHMKSTMDGIKQSKQKTERLPNGRTMRDIVRETRVH